MSYDNIGFGCVSLTQHSFLKGALNILHTAYDEGIKHFDTAPVYGNGYSEKILATFIKNKRHDVTITTKCGLGNLHQPSLPVNIALPLHALRSKFRKKNDSNSIEQPVPLTYRAVTLPYVRASLDNSLQNLETDYIDYYLLHEALPSFLSEEALLFLLDKQQQGVIKNLGVAASYINLLPLNNDALKGFNILQYENGPHYPTDGLIEKFSSKKHFLHSTLKSMPFLKSKYSCSELAGILLNRAIKINPTGKILFSTTNKKRIKANLTGLQKFHELPIAELDKILNAIHRS